MANHSDVSSSVPEKLSLIDEASAWLCRSGYDAALYEIITNIEHECLKRSSLSLEDFNLFFDYGKQAYAEGQPFQNYQKQIGERRKAWRAGWLSAASENATLLRVNEKLLLNAAEFLETLETSKKRLNDMAGITISETQRHELTTLLKRLNFVISAFDDVVSPPHPKETIKEKVEAHG